MGYDGFLCAWRRQERAACAQHGAAARTPKPPKGRVGADQQTVLRGSAARCAGRAMVVIPRVFLALRTCIARLSMLRGNR